MLNESDRPAVRFFDAEQGHLLLALVPASVRDCPGARCHLARAAVADLSELEDE